MLGTILGFFKVKSNLIKLAVLGAIGVSAFFGHAAYKDHIYKNGYNDAVAECNVNVIQGELDRTKRQLDNSRKLSLSLLESVNKLNDNERELTAFIKEVEEKGKDLEGGDISPKTKNFMILLSDRSKIIMGEEPDVQVDNE